MQTARYISTMQNSELTASVTIDVTKIPDTVRDDLAAATLSCVREFLRQPGGREALDAKIAERKAAQAATK